MSLTCELRGLAGTGAPAAHAGALAGRDLSECAPQRRHVRGMLSASTGDERAQVDNLSVSMERHSDARDRSTQIQSAQVGLTWPAPAPGRRTLSADRIEVGLAAALEMELTRKADPL